MKLLQQVLTHYKLHYNRLKKSKKSLTYNKAYLEVFGIEDGVCVYIKYYLKKQVPKAINKPSNFEEGRCMYWTMMPNNADSNKELFQALYYRIEKLKELCKQKSLT